jgi:hypothetical protein
MSYAADIKEGWRYRKLIDDNAWAISNALYHEGFAVWSIARSVPIIQSYAYMDGGKLTRPGRITIDALAVFIRANMHKLAFSHALAAWADNERGVTEVRIVNVCVTRGFSYFQAVKGEERLLLDIANKKVETV